VVLERCSRWIEALTPVRKRQATNGVITAAERWRSIALTLGGKSKSGFWTFDSLASKHCVLSFRGEARLL